MKLPEWVTYIPEYVKALLIAIPAVIELIKQFEQPGWGAEKKAGVLASLRSIMSGLGVRESIVTAIVDGIGGVIDAFVNFKNLVGEFTHSEGAA